MAVQAGSVNTANKFEGYTFDYSDPATIPGSVADGTVIRVYYARDIIGTDPENPDKGAGIPDKYQATVIFNVVNGTWDDGTTSRSIVVTLTDNSGEPAADGKYTIDKIIPDGTPNTGHNTSGGMYFAGEQHVLKEEKFISNPTGKAVSANLNRTPSVKSMASALTALNKGTYSDLGVAAPS